MTPRRPRRLWPKEHGAYAQLLVPLATSFLLAPPTAAGLAWAVAAISAFVAHEAGLVLLGRRGDRARSEAGRRAVGWLAGCGAIAGLALVGALWTAPELAAAVGLVAAAAAVAAGLVLLDVEKSALGELAAAIALSGAGLPVLVAGGAGLERGLVFWGAFALGFMGATGGVRGVIAAGKARSEPLAWPFVVAAGVGCAAGGAARPGLWAAAPLCLAGLGLLAAKPRPRHLRRIGVGLVFVALASGAGLIALLR